MVQFSTQGTAANEPQATPLLVGDVLAEARRLVRDDIADADGAYRVANATFFGWLNEALREVFIDCPDVRMGAAWRTAAPTISATNHDTCLGWDWRSPLAHCLAWRYLSGEDPTRSDKDAETHRQLFRAKIGF